MPDLLADDELTQLLRKGNESAFTHIYNLYWDKLYYIAHRLLKDSNAAEEIVQEVFLTLWRKKETLAIESLNSYLAAMTRYAVYKYLAKQKIFKVKEDQVARINASAISEIDVDNKILLEIIAELSNKLPEKCRLVFQYNKLQDKPLAEVAEQLGISQKTAEAHLTKALRTIRSSMSNAKTDYMQIIILMAILKR
ncbi:MAG: sigma-70 family RNA polymerase sigma factor [Mucilaginibacter sp.]